MNLIWHFKKFENLTSLELYDILRLRYEIFVVEQNCIYNDCDGKDKCSFHLWTTSDDDMIAYCRIVPPGISYEEPSIGRVVTHPDFRNKKFGNQLMSLAIQIIENLYPTSSIRIGAQSYLKNFYEKFGFEQVSEDYLEDGILHMEMLKREKAGFGKI